MTPDDRCGYTVTDEDGILQPCDRPTTGWRWYQDVEHEDLLEVACELHENEGGRRMHAAEAKIEQVEAIHARREFEDSPGVYYCGHCQTTAGLWPCPTVAALADPKGET